MLAYALTRHRGTNLRKVLTAMNLSKVLMATNLSNVLIAMNLSKILIAGCTACVLSYI